jgi:polyisoprenoid-binding protein YceI
MGKSTMFKVASTVAVLGLTFGALAARRAALIASFDLKDNKGANGIHIAMLGGLEPIHGTGNDVSGMVNLDLDNPSNSTAKVEIGVASLKLTNPDMTKNMMGEWCLDAEKHPKATFVMTSAKLKQGKNSMITGMITGDFTLKGITKSYKMPITARYVANGVKTRYGEGAGDVIVVNAKFSFKRFDFNIGRTLDKAVLSDEVEVNLNVAGTAFKK